MRTLLAAFPVAAALPTALFVALLAAGTSLAFPAAADTALSSVATGGHHACGLTASGGVQCWGRNFDGQLGDGTNTDRLVPTNVSGLASGVVSIAAGEFHNCAVTTAGGLKCWGLNTYGHLGNNSNVTATTPVDVSGLASGVVAVATGYSFTCALTSTGGVKCWGLNNNGQLGDNINFPRFVPTDVAGLSSGVAAIAAGVNHACALTTAGAVKCWGGNQYGALGDGTTTDRFTPMDVVGLGSGVAAIAVGGLQSCALTSGGAVKCWGAAPVGDGTNDSRTLPTDVVGLGSGVVAVEVGTTHTCALLATGSLKCWGYNDAGQLGDGTITLQWTPTDVTGFAGTGIAVAAGNGQSCAITTAGAARCWGRNDWGQVGDGSTTNRLAPVAVSGLDYKLRAIESSHGSHTCAIDPSGGLACWGYNEFAQLGDGTTTDRAVPVAVSGMTGNVASVAPGQLHTCALTDGGAVKCWGRNDLGQIGDGTTAQRATPTSVSGLSGGVASIASGSAHSCARTTGGGVKCWGQNSSGQLGNGTTADASSPVDVTGLSSGVAAIVAGQGHTCALTTGGGVKCWGGNLSGQLGNSSFTSSSTPVDVTDLASGVAALAAGSHTCALTTGGAVKCWGANFSGQVGDATTTSRNAPVAVSGLASGIAAITARYASTCALTTAGGLKCWGNNEYGQIGNESVYLQTSVPVDVTGLASGVLVASAGGFHTCAIVSTGHLKCWGYNGNGQLAAAPPYAGTPITSSIGPQTISFSPPTSGSVGVGIALTASATSTLTVVIDNLTPTSCSLSAGTVTPSAAGVCLVRASQAGTGAWFPAAPQLRFIATPLTSQAIIFGALADKASNAAPFVVSATGGASGNPVTFGSFTPSVCTTGGTNGETVTLTGALGTCTIAANQAGNATYGAAPQVTQSFSVLGQLTFTVVLEGAQEVPVNGSPATGSGTVTVDNAAKTLAYSFSYSNLTAAVSAAHFHGPAARGVGAGVKIDIGANPTGGTVNYSPADEADILAGNWYVNFHTATYSGGEIRGQLDNLGAAPRQTLSVATNGAGTGTVTSGASTSGIDCGATCSHSFPQGLTVVLTASAGANSTFGSWTGCPSPSGSQCTVVMSAAVSVTATFLANQAISFGALATRTTVDPPFPVSATGGASGNAVTFTSLTTPVCTTGGTNGSTVTIVAVGTCTIAADQAGNASYTAAPQATQSFSVTLPIIGSISAGNQHTCAVSAAGGVHCWGENNGGELGNGVFYDNAYPGLVSGLASGVAAVAAGGTHTCALTTGGAAKCWGSDATGQLGNGAGGGSGLPVDVSGLAVGVTAIAAGAAHSCAIVGGGAKCWGNNGNGQVGDGTTANAQVPVDVTGLASGIAAIAPGGLHTCALTTGGAVKCWGSNSNGQLGDGTTTQRLAPVDVPGLASGVVALSTGFFHSCALMATGGVKCWGDNTYGALGDGTFTQRLLPTDVSSLGSGIVAIDAGGYHTCARTNASTLKCWGNNGTYQVGHVDSAPQSSPYEVTSLGSGVEAVTAGSSHTCVIASGAVRCFGSAVSGQVGNGDFTSGPTPVVATGLAGALGQAITFNALPDKQTTNPPFNVSATGGASGNPVTFASLTPAICTTGGTNGATVTLTGSTGTCTIRASQAGNPSYFAAVNVDRSFLVSAPTGGAPPRSGFNGDVRSDVLWRDSTGGLVYQWQMNGLAISGQGYMPSVPTNWMVGGVGDVSGDGSADILWREAGGLNYLWIVSGLGITSQGYLPSVPNPWIVVGLGDASGDGKADVFWRNPTTGQNYLWIMNGLSITSQGYLPSVAGSDWEVVGVADYSGDGKADALWRNKATGQNYLWVMNGLVVASQGFMPSVAGSDWEVVGSPDADGDGKADVLWRHKTTGQNYLWVMNGLAVTSQGYLPSVAGAAWKVVGFGDYNGDGKGDVLWRNTSTGQNYLWILNGLSVTSQGFLPSVSGTNWMPVK